MVLEGIKNLDFWQEMVTGLLVENNKIVGVKTGLGVEMKAKNVILTNGTFLNGLIHIGDKSFGGGRASERASTGITEELKALGFEAGRMKTGTPPRVDGRTLDYSKMEEQPGDDNIVGFSYMPTKKPTKQRSCYITYTSEEVHKILHFLTCPLKSLQNKGLVTSLTPQKKFIKFYRKGLRSRQCFREELKD